MWRNKKVLVIALGSAALVIASIGGVALARSGAITGAQPRILADTTANTTGNATQPKTLLARVAEILGIDQTKLEAAVKQAKAEQQLAILKNRLQKLVEAGKITQAQADAYLKWVQSKPDLGPYQQQLKQWQQGRPQLPQEFKDWEKARPDVPLPGGHRPGGHLPRMRGGRMGAMGMGGLNLPAQNLPVN